MFPLRLFFARFWRGRIATRLFLQRFRSAAQLPFSSSRNAMLPAPAAPTSRYSHLPRIFARAAMLFVPLVVLGGFLAIKIVRYGSAELPQISADSLAADWQTSLDLSASSVAHRPVFPYSIVPGGVRDARELQSAASKDPVVAAHYSDFRMALSRAVRLDHPLEMYVSY